MEAALLLTIMLMPVVFFVTVASLVALAQKSLTLDAIFKLIPTVRVNRKALLVSASLK